MSKLIEIQRELKVLKSQFNAFSNYNYRSTEDILLALKPFLVKNEVNLVMSDKMIAIGEHAYVEARVEFSAEGEQYAVTSSARDPIVQKGMNAPQCTNSASSFARKQALSGLFLLDDTATPIASKEEQEQADTAAVEQKNADELRIKDEIEDFLNKAHSSIHGALSIEELRAVYKALYRSAQKFGADVASTVENYYRSKKETFDATV